VALAAEQLAARIGAECDDFRVCKLFRGHAAWGRLIRSPARGLVLLDDPTMPPRIPAASPSPCDD
jgi:hypothetical protein